MRDACPSTAAGIEACSPARSGRILPRRRTMPVPITVENHEGVKRRARMSNPCTCRCDTWRRTGEPSSLVVRPSLDSPRSELLDRSDGSGSTAGSSVGFPAEVKSVSAIAPRRCRPAARPPLQTASPGALACVRCPRDSSRESSGRRQASHVDRRRFRPPTVSGDHTSTQARQRAAWGRADELDETEPGPSPLALCVLIPAERGCEVLQTALATAPTLHATADDAHAPQDDAAPSPRACLRRVTTPRSHGQRELVQLLVRDASARALLTAHSFSLTTFAPNGTQEVNDDRD